MNLPARMETLCREYLSVQATSTDAEATHQLKVAFTDEMKALLELPLSMSLEDKARAFDAMARQHIDMLKVELDERMAGTFVEGYEGAQVSTAWERHNKTVFGATIYKVLNIIPLVLPVDTADEGYAGA